MSIIDAFYYYRTYKHRRQTVELVQILKKTFHNHQISSPPVRFINFFVDIQVILYQFKNQSIFLLQKHTMRWRAE